MKSRIYDFLDYIGAEFRRHDYPSKINCPFHDDEHASAKVYPMSDTIHCFRCNRTWTVETAWMTYYRVPFEVASKQTSELFPETTSPFERETTVRFETNDVQIWEQLREALFHRIILTGAPAAFSIALRELEQITSVPDRIEAGMRLSQRLSEWRISNEDT